MISDPVISFEDVSKIYRLPGGDVTALDRISFTVNPGDFISVMGPSGSGKSTLLNLIGCLDTPTGGEISLGGTSTRELSDTELTHLRRDRIGFVFQYFNLFPLLDTVENVNFPRLLKDGDRADPGRAKDLLRAVSLDDSLFTHTPTELSGGQQQRVAIARALINDPDILLCDEPTGNLDSRTGAAIMELLSRFNREGKTIIMVTHDPGNAAYSRRTIRIADGRLA
jgi:putative ABC transport system ATP-binding protein